LIDPHNFTKFDRTEAELEEMFIFSVAVAGKTAVVIAEKVDRFLWLCRQKVAKWLMKSRLKARVLDFGPFRLLRCLRAEGRYSGRDEITPLLKKAKVGKYTLLGKALHQIAEESYEGRLDIRTAKVQQLESIYGVGPKTARMFVMHSRPDQRVAALDTHILAWLREQGYKAPKSTPSSPRQYALLERVFLDYADSAGMSPADFDLKIWKERTRVGKRKGSKKALTAAKETAQ
jgi:thermostable 8-oxoguanine DNA glycosylase